jgi:hypothetical protein
MSNHRLESTGNELEEIVRSAHENIRKLQQISLIPSQDQNKTKSTPHMKQPLTTKPRAMSGSHLRSSSAPKPSHPVNELSSSSSSDYILRKVDFLFKKMKEMENQMNGLKSSSKESQTLSSHLSEIIKMDKHSIVEMREQVMGLKQKIERFGQQDLLQNSHRGKFSENSSTAIPIPGPDVGVLSEQIFHRVHKEFTKVVDEVVRACVNEQVEFMRKWSNKTSEDDDGEIRAQISSLKRRQNLFDERLNELKGEEPAPLSLSPSLSLSLAHHTQTRVINQE